IFGSGSYNDIDVQSNEVCRDPGETIAASLSPGIRYGNGTALNPAEFTQSLQEGRKPFALDSGRALAQEPDDWLFLLRARRERPRCRRTADKSNEIAPPHALPLSPQADGRTLSH